MFRRRDKCSGLYYAAGRKSMQVGSRAGTAGARDELRRPVRVHMVGRPQFDVEEFLAFLDETRTNWLRSLGAKEPEELVAAAGRVCYMSCGTGRSLRCMAAYGKSVMTMCCVRVL